MSRIFMLFLMFAIFPFMLMTGWHWGVFELGLWLSGDAAADIELKVMVSALSSLPLLLLLSLTFGRFREPAMLALLYCCVLWLDCPWLAYFLLAVVAIWTLRVKEWSAWSYSEAYGHLFVFYSYIFSAYLAGRLSGIGVTFSVFQACLLDGLALYCFVKCATVRDW